MSEKVLIHQRERLQSVCESFANTKRDLERVSLSDNPVFTGDRDEVGQLRSIAIALQKSIVEAHDILNTVKRVRLTNNKELERVNNLASALIDKFKDQFEILIGSKGVVKQKSMVDEVCAECAQVLKSAQETMAQSKVKDV